MIKRTAFFKILVLLVSVHALSACFYRPRFSHDTSFKAPFYYVKVIEGPEAFRYLLKDVSSCYFQGYPYICGTSSESGWLESRTIYINPKSIVTMATFNSMEEYTSALDKS